jgi:hypothetical protein
MSDFTLPGHVIPRHQPHTWSLGGKNGMLVSINMDTGETTFGAGYNDPSEAARVFWEAVASVVRRAKSPEHAAWCEGRDAAAAEIDRTWREASAFDLVRELKSPYGEQT